MQNDPNNDFFKYFDISNLNPGDPNFTNKKPQPVLETFSVNNTPQITQRNKTIEKYNNPINLEQIYNVINPPKIKNANNYSVYDANKLLNSQNIGTENIQGPNYITNSVDSLNYIKGPSNKVSTILNGINNIKTVSNTVPTAKSPSLINGINKIVTNQNIVNNIQTPTVIKGVNNITTNPNIVTKITTPTIINGVNPTQKIITNVKPPTIINEVKNIVPTQKIITTVQSPNLVNNIGNIVTNKNIVNNNLKNPNINNLISKNPKGYNNIPKVGVNLGRLNNPILNLKNIVPLNNSEPGERINLSEFKIINEIGKGTFGKIYRVIWLVNYKFYALKKEILHDIEGVRIRQHRNQTIRNFVRRTNCEGIVNIYGNFCIPKGNEYHNFELMELCEKDFEQEIKKKAQYNSFYSEMELYNIMFQLIKTLSFLQKNHITHRDIKPQNILISHGIYKLCDFGDVRLMQRNGIVVQRVRGSELFMSPLLFNGLRANVIHVRHNTYKSDVFSLGMCFLLAACLSYDGLVEIREVNDMRQKEMILNKYLSARYSPKCINIILLMLQTEEINRPDFILLENAIREYGF